MRKTFFVLPLVLLSLTLLSCSGGGGGSSSGGGSSYSINLQPNNTSVILGRNVTLKAYVNDGKGSPVTDSINKVRFSSSFLGVFAEVNPDNGVAVATYTASKLSSSTTTRPYGNDYVTAFFRGTSAYATIVVVEP
jgi:hypothetical protein